MKTIQIISIGVVIGIIVFILLNIYTSVREKDRKLSGPEPTLEKYFEALRRGNVVGVGEVLTTDKAFELSEPINIESYEIIARRVLTKEEAEKMLFTPAIKEGDVQFDVRQRTIEGENVFNEMYSYWFREAGGGEWRLFIWTAWQGTAL